MIIIKRYPNRKLYDTSVKRYVTLEGIADLIRQGKELQVLDHTSGEDLTALTLTQIIFEQEKKNSGFLPRSVLTGLVKAGGDTLTTLRRSLASPLDMLRQVDEEIEQRVQSLIKRGEMAEEEGKRILDKLTSPSSRLRPFAVSATDIEEYLSHRGVPTKGDLEDLGTQLDRLAASLDELNGGSEVVEEA